MNNNHDFFTRITSGAVVFLDGCSSKLANGFLPLKLHVEPEKIVTGKGYSFWKPSFSGSMSNFGGVINGWDVIRVFVDPGANCLRVMRVSPFWCHFGARKFE